MPPVLRSLLRACGSALAMWALLASPSAHAQQQEEGILVKVKRGGMANDESFAFDGAHKAFNTTASVGAKQARVKPYAFTGSSAFGGADGTFRTASFVDRGKFRTGEFATKADRANNANSFTQADRGFATKEMTVRDAPGVDKSAFGMHSYQPADKSIVIRGKRQGDLDDLYQQKNLSIDQVREILNKPGHGTDAPLQRMGDAPVLRATAVPSPEAR